MAAKSKPGQKARTAKTKLLEPKKRSEEWVTEGKEEKQEDDNLWSTQLAKNRRSRFAKTDRDELSMEKNARNNVVFKGADCCHARRLMHNPFSDSCTVTDVPSVTPWSWQVYVRAHSRTERLSLLLFGGALHTEAILQALALGTAKAYSERGACQYFRASRNVRAVAGKLFSGGTSAAVGVTLDVEEDLMASSEGIIVRALGDGQQYNVQLTQGKATYAACDQLLSQGCCRSTQSSVLP